MMTGHLTRAPLLACFTLGLLASASGQILEPTLAIVQPTAEAVLRGRTIRPTASRA